MDQALRTMSLSDEDTLVLPTDPSYCVTESNTLSILGRLLNPDCQSMSRMIENMPRIWRLYERVRGIALTKERFQFIFQTEHDLIVVLNGGPWTYNDWSMVIDRWVEIPLLSVD